MAEQMVLVCDICGQAAADTVRLEVGGRRLLKDYCASHLAELTANARTPRRGRTRGSTRPSGTGASARGAAKRSTGRGKTTRTSRPRRARAATREDLGTEIRKLREGGLSYRQIGEELLARGIKPQRAKQWNPIVIGRLLKRTA